MFFCGGVFGAGFAAERGDPTFWADELFMVSAETGIVNISVTGDEPCEFSAGEAEAVAFSAYEFI